MCQKPKGCKENNEASTTEAASPTVASPQGSITNLNEASNISSHKIPRDVRPQASSLSSFEGRRSQTSPPLVKSVSALLTNACKAVISGNSVDAVNLFLLYGGDPRKKFTSVMFWSLELVDNILFFTG